MLNGTTTTINTYKNKPLNGGNKFTVVNVEILGFKEN